MNPVFIPISVVLLASSVLGDYDYYCPEPEVPTYGYIAKGQKSYYKVGNEVEYACKHGYKLWGEKRISCVSKGTVQSWDGETPVCKKGE